MFNLQLGIPKIEEQFLRNQPLRRYFDNNFINDSPNSIELHCLTDYFYPSVGRYRCKHLIMVLKEGIPLIAITACEYSLHPSHMPNSDERSLYIQYIDNSGLQDSSFKNSLTKNCIWNLLDFALADGISKIHLFSSSQPSLLFMDSNLNEGKTVLPPIVLANWWVSIVEAWRLANSDGIDRIRSRPFAYDPSIHNLFPTFTRHIKETIRRLGWKEGLLCLGNGSNAVTTTTTTATTATTTNFYTPPLFEGDPKLRHWEALSSNKGKEPKIDKRGFFGTMSYRVEFRENPSLFIGIMNSNGNGICTSKSISGAEVDLDWASNNRVANFILNRLRDMSFSPKNYQRESLKLVSWLKIVGSHPLKISPSSNALLEDRKEKFKSIFSEIIDTDGLEMSQISVSACNGVKRQHSGTTNGHTSEDHHSINIQSLCKRKAMN